MPKMLRLAATIWKCPDFLPEISGILDTRIRPFCNSGYNLTSYQTQYTKHQIYQSQSTIPNPQKLNLPGKLFKM